MDGRIPPLKGGAKMTIRYIKSGSKNMVMTLHETDTSITIYVGNRTIYCIDVQLLKKVNGELYDVGNLSKIRCIDDFEKGTDSIMIMKLVISYIHSNYPIVKTLRFTDLSVKE